jgi:serine/threonine protein kinase
MGPDKSILCHNAAIDEHVKILDFGLAKLTEQGEEVQANAPTTTTTQAGTVIGTAGCMSPEQARGHKMDHRSDIFSFGAVLYEMAAGRRAFNGDSAVEVRHAIITSNPPELSDPALERASCAAAWKSAPSGDSSWPATWHSRSRN